MSGPMIEALRAHAPPLIVLVLILGAAVSALLPDRRAAGVVASGAVLAAAALALDLAARAVRSVSIEYLVGADAAGQSLTLRIDGVAAAALAQIGFIAGFAGVSAAGITRGTFDAAKEPLASALLLLSLAGLFVCVMTTDVFVAALGLQLFGVSAASFSALGALQDRRALTAANHHLTAVAVGGASMFMGVALILRATGVQDIERLAAFFAGDAPKALAAGGALVVAVGLALQAGVPPLHGWATLSASRGPHAAALIIATAGLAAPLYAGLRLASALAPSPALGAIVSNAFLAFGLVGVALASAQALATSDLRRLALHASLAGFAAGLMGLGVGGEAAAAASFAQFAAAGIGATALFSAAALVTRGGSASTPLSSLDGLGRRAPFAALALTFGLLSLAGAPLTFGFTAKWLSFSAFLETGWWGLAVALALSALALAFAAARALGRIWLKDPVAGAPSIASGRRAAWLPLGAAAIAAIGFGLEGRLPLALAEAAASAFLSRPTP